MKQRVTIITVLVFILIAQLSWAQIPQTMSYQGFLTDASSAPVDDGDYSLAFSIYNVETGGDALWSETHASVAVNEGIFNVILGSVTPLNIAFDAQYWLEVEVNGAMVSPRVPLTSSAYSLNARSVADGAVTEDKIAANAVTSGRIDNSAVTTFHILNGTIIAEDVSFNYAGSTSPAGPATDLVSSGAVDTTDIADDAVIGDKIADGQIVRSLNGKMDAVTLAEGTNITITPGGNTLTISAAFSSWSLTGNAGTNPTTNFLGTTDDQALEFRINNGRALRLEPHATSPNVIGGFSGNNVTSGVYGATISGGGQSGLENVVSDDCGTVGGGYGNTVSGLDATIGGGNVNDASGYATTVGGGSNNTASDYAATVGGGIVNTASGFGSAIVGGQNNEASGTFATVAGGNSNIAQGDYSFAAGQNAKVIHGGSFVFADSTGSVFSSSMANEFSVRCTGGVRFYTQWTPSPTAGVKLFPGGIAWSAISDRNIKENFTPVDNRDILRRLASLPVETWNAKSQDPSIRHIGPMAQDFYAAFGLGEDDKHITTVDADGVALVAIQGLYELVQEKDVQNAKLRAEVDDLKERLAALEKSLSSHNQK